MAARQKTRVVLLSHKGCVRENNEDNFFLNGDLMPLAEMDQGALIDQRFRASCQMFAVCDGMGGAKLGERAAYIAANGLCAPYLKMPSKVLDKEIDAYARKASATIRQDCREHKADMEGTTLALLALQKGTAYVANVGDSRVYRLRDRELEQLSFDHSLVNRMRLEHRMTAEQARKSPQNNIITQFLGMPKEQMTDEFVFQAASKAMKGDRYLLCSDGLCDMMSDAAMEEILLRRTDALEAAKELVSLALEMGGKDNTTCMLVELI